MTKPALGIRDATVNDRSYFWEVNNVPPTRSLSISTDPIPWAEHKRWYAARLVDPATNLYIAESAGVRVGVAHLEHKGADAAISIALSPDHQGRGLGRRFIAKATRVALASGTTTRIIALIRSDNTRSINAFVAAGYVLAGQEGAEGIELLRYEATK